MLLWPAAIGAALSVGCSPTRTAVYVDLDSPLGAAFVEEPVQPPKRMLAQDEPWAVRAAIEPLPHPGAVLDVSKQAMVEAREVLATNRARAVRSLQAELFRAYRKEVERQAIEDQRSVAEIAERAYGEADASASALLGSIAAQRGDILNVLALRVEFPVPPVDTWAPVAEDRIWERRWRDQAEKLARELAQLDAAYRESVEALFRRAHEQVAATRAELRLAAAQRLDEAKSRAIREAEEAFRDGGEVASVLTDRELTRIAPDLGEEVVVVKAEPPSTGPGGKIPGRRPDPRAALEAECRIWAELNGYRLVASKDIGRDATKEFWAWKSTRHPGRWAD